ncbi:Leucine-rich repeat neuronal protein 1 [Aphelenchoides besseyi]|nr:Leucine-rich repeat neuronal protein 1 [Aphelenchoides besseyi]
MKWTIGFLIEVLVVLLQLCVVFAHVGDSCPYDCQCDEKKTSLSCERLTSKQIADLFSNISFVDSYSSRIYNLSLVNCSLHDVNVIPVELLRGLLHLDLSFNQLNDFKFSSLNHFMPLLIKLKLTGNHLVGIPRTLFSSVPNVEEVYLDNNKIFSIDWEAFRLYKLKRLWLTNNNLLSINEHILRFTPNLEFLDLSQNQLISVQSSSFFSARRLIELNLSNNRLQRFDYDSFVPLHQLQTLDLSFNNFSEVPVGLSQIVGLRVLNFSGNPITRIRSGDFQLPILQVIVLSNCPLVKIIESRAFMEMPNIHTVTISNNPKLEFISPIAFVNNTGIYEIDFRNNSLSVVYFNNTAPSRLLVSGNPLQCECMTSILEQLDRHVIDSNEITCKLPEAKDGKESIGLKEFGRKYANRECSSHPLTPMGREVRAEIGQHFSIYCGARLATDTITWENKNQSRSVTSLPTVRPSQIPMHSVIHSLSPQPIELLQMAHNQRIQHIDEQLLIQTVTEEDGGEYICQVERNGKTVSRTAINLHVVRPSISLYPLDVGSHYAALSWNNSLDIQWTANVRLMMAVRDENNSTLRVIQLNILNPWFGYNVLRLKPEHNYTFCLFYEFIYNYPGTIYETCTTTRTLSSLSFWTSLHPSTVFSLLGFLIFIIVLMCFRGFYIRFYIWHQTKARSRMNQSISGQSFLSRSTSNANGTLMDSSITYDNNTAVRMSTMSTPSTENGVLDGHENLLTNDACV